MPFYHDLKTYRDDPRHADYPGMADWIARRLLTLRYDLKQAIIKDRRPNSLIVGSWNIRAFDGGLPRLPESLHYIAEVVSAFDICAIQEVREDMTALQRLMRLLGPNWDYFVTDVSRHEGGNHERMAFVFNRDKVFFRNIIGEIVLRSDALSTGRQIARSPFFAAFQAHWFRFTLCSAHIVFGDDLSLRAEEVRAITDALVARAKREDQVFIFLGDMNIDDPEGEVMTALRESAMEVPAFPPTNMKGDRYYDQMAFTVKGKSTNKTRLLRAGAFDWRNAVYGPAQPVDPAAPGDPALVGRLTDAEQVAHYEGIVTRHRAAHGKDPYADFSRSHATWMTHEMSDHLPIWMELETDYSDAYLTRYLTTP